MEYNIKYANPVSVSNDLVHGEISEILSSGKLTNGKYVERFEEAIRTYLNVRNAVCVSSCTNGLMLAIRSLQLPKESNVILPSFSFLATALAPYWNGLNIKYIDIDKHDLNINFRQLENKINASTSLIIGVHQFGNPCAIDMLESLSLSKNIRLLFDSAHALGSRYYNNHVGKYGDVEVFSLSPTKIITACEGGIITTNNDELAETLRILRVYGCDEDYDCHIPGLSSRMSEINAVIGYHNLQYIDRNIDARNAIANLYMSLLENVGDIRFQKIKEFDKSTYKDFCIISEKANKIQKQLFINKIETKKYYSPAIHRTNYFDDSEDLTTTDEVSKNILCLPIYPDIKISQIMEITNNIKKVFDNGGMDE